MQIELTEEQLLLRDTVRRFADEVVAPRAKEIDASGRVPARLLPTRPGELGLAGVCVPEELRRRRHGHDRLLPGDRGDQPGLRLERRHPLGQQLAGLRPAPPFGNEEQKRRVPDSARRGREARLLRAHRARGRQRRRQRCARRRAATATTTCSTATRSSSPTAPTPTSRWSSPPSTRRRSTAASPPSSCRRDTPGFQRGHHEYKLGRPRLRHDRSSPSSDLRVPARQRLGEEGEGFKIAMATLDGGRIGIAAQAVGIAQGAFEEALAYAKERKQFGQPIADFQAIQFYLADMAMELDAARLLICKAAWAKDDAEALHAWRRRRPSSSPRRWRSGSPTRRCRSTAATATPGVRRRALLPRRPHHRDLRGHERDPEDGHRRLDPQGGLSAADEARMAVDFALTESRSCCAASCAASPRSGSVPGAAERDRAHEFPAGLVARDGGDGPARHAGRRSDTAAAASDRVYLLRGGRGDRARLPVDSRSP